MRMRYERREGRDREVENEQAVRGPAAQEEEPNREPTVNKSDNDATPTRRGSSSERSER